MGGVDLGCGVIWKDEKSASGDLEEVVEEIVDPTVLNAYGVKEIANRLRRTMIGPVSEDLGKVGSLKSLEYYPEKKTTNKTSKGVFDANMPRRKAYLRGFKDGAHAHKKLIANKPVSGDLEAAIDNYLATYFGGEKEKQEWPFLKKMAIHFANWQKKKDDYAIEIAHMAGEEEGKNIMKQQMMAKAIDATVHIDAGGYPYIQQMELYDYDKDIPLAKEGDKYKVILIKED